VIIAVCGSPGAGKTTVAKAIASRLGVLLLTRDEVKNGLGLSSGYEPDFHIAGGPYSRRAETIMVDLARRLHAAGVGFVVESSVLPKELADAVRLWVHVVARPEVIDARLQARPDRQLADQFRRGEMPATIFAPPAGVDAVVEIDTSDRESPDVEAVMTRLGPGPRRTW
jgi:predicted kinase